MDSGDIAHISVVCWRGQASVSAPVVTGLGIATTAEPKWNACLCYKTCFVHIRPARFRLTGQEHVRGHADKVSRRCRP